MPLSFINFPVLIFSRIASASSFAINIFAEIVSVKSVTLKIYIIFSLRISRSSVDTTSPSITTSPIPSCISAILIISPSQFLP